MTDSTNADGSNDKTVENAEELGGGYGGPFPVSPEEEGTTDGSGASDADSDCRSGLRLERGIRHRRMMRDG